MQTRTKLRRQNKLIRCVISPVFIWKTNDAYWLVVQPVMDASSRWFTKQRQVCRLDHARIEKKYAREWQKKKSFSVGTSEQRDTQTICRGSSLCLSALNILRCENMIQIGPCRHILIGCHLRSFHDSTLDLPLNKLLHRARVLPRNSKLDSENDFGIRIISLLLATCIPRRG
jgi:hypothetical protein